MKKTITKNTVLIDRHEEVLKQLNENVPAALKAVGIEAVGLIVKNMQHGYGKPIRVTGDLMRDVNYTVDADHSRVWVGNSLKYARRIHEGDSKLKGRPYITDAIYKSVGRERLQKVMENNISHNIP